MSGRGRGRGGGPGVSFNTELLGIGRGKDAAPATVLAPPPKYPPRTVKPRPLIQDNEQEYLLAIKKEWLNQMRSSQFYLKDRRFEDAKEKKIVERYSDRYENTTEKPLDLDWSQFPKELHPEFRGRSTAAKRKANKSGKTAGGGKLNKSGDISKKLEELEKKEKQTSKKDDEDDRNKSNDKDEDEEDEKEPDEPDSDESMDEGTDYANNFFDNGEAYLEEEDDNLDEGGIY